VGTYFQNALRARGIRARALGVAKAAGGGEQSGFNGQFFPPGQPLVPMAPRAAGRAWDYPTGVNLNYQPRQQQGLKNVTFETLRRLADPAQGGFDLVRAAIEKRKKDMKLQEWHIVGRNGEDGGSAAKDAMALLRKPDGFQPWRTWLGQLLEDHFVIDAPTVYFRDGPKRLLFELIDGATIDLLLDDNGRTPMPPLNAYQQVLKGLPAVGYTVEELGYYVDNPRPGRIYGFSPVEQMVTFITIALNRQLSVLNYYTAGSIPDMLISTPANWQPNQIAEFEENWNAVLAGQTDLRRQARFIPDGSKPFESKQEILKNELDEWIARVTCFFFDLSPESLVKQTNRATAETAKESAAEQGTENTKQYVKVVVDDMLERAGGGDLELAWLDEEINDALVKAQVTALYTKQKAIMTIAEAREMAGLKPATPEQMDELDAANAPPVSPFGDPLGDGTGDNPDSPTPPANGTQPPTNGTTPPTATDEKTTKAATSRGGRSLPRVPRDAKRRKKTRDAIAAVVAQELARQKDALLHKLSTLSKATAEEIAGLRAELARTPWDESIIGKLRELLQEWSVARSTTTMKALESFVDASGGEYTDLLTTANEAAVEFARERVGNLVVGIDEASQDFLNELTSSAIEDGLTNDELGALISESYGFSEDRGLVIARTETAIADGAAKMIGYRSSGVVTGKEWSPDAEACPICLDNAAQGTIPIDDVFASGDDAEPAHPNCECSVVPVVEED
jgi:hypothetical protein